MDRECVIQEIEEYKDINKVNTVRNMDKCENQDIIDFRNELIKKTYSKNYLLGSTCNDNKTNVMTRERKEVLEDVLVMFNEHFSIRGYEIK